MTNNETTFGGSHLHIDELLFVVLPLLFYLSVGWRGFVNRVQMFMGVAGLLNLIQYRNDGEWVKQKNQPFRNKLLKSLIPSK